MPKGAVERLSNKKPPNRYATARYSLRTRCFRPTRGDQHRLLQINELSDSWMNVTNAKLQSTVHELKNRVAAGQACTDDAVLIKAMAIAKQALLRTVRMSAYDVQVLAGIAMAQGAIAEMQTGEGKTLTSVFPIVVHALAGNGVHVATVNSYLAKRDYDYLQPVFESLGLTVGISMDGESTTQKQAAYQCDVTFATGYELGFDFLRDQIATRLVRTNRLGAKLRMDVAQHTGRASNLAQRGHAVAVIDEIDSVLIDEATTPLVLSSGALAAQAPAAGYNAARHVAKNLEIDQDFVIDQQRKSLKLTRRGTTSIHEQRDEALVAADAHGALALLRPWSDYVTAALRAEHLMLRDVNYVIRDDSVQIVDEFTGRIFSDRNWRDGLHQAVEAKEGVLLTAEKRTIARISRQRYFQKYDMLCGMTGTAAGHQSELLACYRTPIVVIPLRKNSRRGELATRYFASEEDKRTAIVADIQRRHRVGQPVLVGTRTIAQSHGLSAQLSAQGVPHQLLNGVQDEDEAALISRAGNSGAVTVATNMAGRGTDVKPDANAFAVGGLHVIGYERNASRRIDRQLLGRSGRQGSPGSGQYFVSGTDEIISQHYVGLGRALGRIAFAEGISSRDYDRRIRRIQAVAEKASHQSRRAIMREEMWLDDVKKNAG